MPTLTQPSKPVTSIPTDFGKIACPIYVGIDHECSKHILEVLRSKIATPDVETTSGLRVQASGISEGQKAMESRLRIDLATLRFCLFDSMQRGVPLDLALRIQKECGDDYVFITQKTLDAAYKNSLKTYNFYANGQ